LSQARPPEVDSFAVALSEWLASFTMPESLAGEMADVCSGGAPWPAAIGGTAARRSGWGDAEALIWGIAVGGLAGGLEGVSASFASSVDVGRTPGTAVDGAAGTLLAADGLVAAAHEALGSLGPDRLEIAARTDPQGPWTDYANAWCAVYGSRGPAEAAGDSNSLWDHPAADDVTRALMQAATDEARAAQAELTARLERR
jgi:hypothetical protein